MLKLRDEQWERIREHFPEENIPDIRPGRKPIPTRRVLEAVLWILNTGAQWHMLPQGYPNYKNSDDAASITGQPLLWMAVSIESVVRRARGDNTIVKFKAQPTPAMGC